MTLAADQEATVTAGSVTEPSARRRFRRAILAWFGANGRDFPWRQTREPFHVLVAEVLLQQTLAYKVAPAYEAITQRFGSAAKLAAAPPEELREIVRPLGLLKRATTLKEIGRVVAERHGGDVPRTDAELRSLPGVGDYTSAAVRCFAFGEREAIIDSNVVRVMTRYFDLDAAPGTRLAANMASTAARQCLPRRDVERWNWALLDHAAKVCRTSRPRCASCPLASSCPASFQVRPARTRTAG